MLFLTSNTSWRETLTVSLILILRQHHHVNLARDTLRMLGSMTRMSTPSELILRISAKVDDKDYNDVEVGEQSFQKFDSTLHEIVNQSNMHRSNHLHSSVTSLIKNFQCIIRTSHSRNPLVAVKLMTVEINSPVRQVLASQLPTIACPTQ